MKEFCAGVTCEWFHNNHIVVYTLHDPRKSVLAAWSSAVLDMLESWPQDKPYLAVHDISRSGVGLLYCAAVADDIFNIGVVPEARPQIDEMITARPNWQVGLSVVLAGSLSGRLSKLLMKSGADDNRVQSRAFFFRDKAIDSLIGLEAAIDR